MNDKATTAASKTVKMLAHVEALNVKTGGALTGEPIRPHIQALIDAGLLSASRMRCGPLGILTGEVSLRVTEEGKKLLPSGK